MAGIFHAHLGAMENTHTDVSMWKVKEWWLWYMYRQFQPFSGLKYQ